MSVGGRAGRRASGRAMRKRHEQWAAARKRKQARFSTNPLVDTKCTTPPMSSLGLTHSPPSPVKTRGSGKLLPSSCEPVPSHKALEGRSPKLRPKPTPDEGDFSSSSSSRRRRSSSSSSSRKGETHCCYLPQLLLLLQRRQPRVQYQHWVA